MPFWPNEQKTLQTSRHWVHCLSPKKSSLAQLLRGAERCVMASPVGDPMTQKLVRWALVWWSPQVKVGPVLGPSRLGSVQLLQNVCLSGDMTGVLACRGSVEVWIQYREVWTRSSESCFLSSLILSCSPPPPLLSLLKPWIYPPNLPVFLNHLSPKTPSPGEVEGSCSLQCDCHLERWRVL